MLEKKNQSSKIELRHMTTCMLWSPDCKFQDIKIIFFFPTF